MLCSKSTPSSNQGPFLSGDLDSIPWINLQDAYGKAEKVPELIRVIQNSADQQKLEAWDKFYAHVLHQGTVYSCTPFALSFILDELSNLADELTLRIFCDISELFEKPQPNSLYWQQSHRSLKERQDIFLSFIESQNSEVSEAAEDLLNLIDNHSI